MPQTIHQHHLTDPWRFRYSPKDHIPGYQGGGVAFQAFGTQETGSVPVYELRANDPVRYQLSTNPNVGQGWKNPQVAFYALDSKRAGAVPVYAHLPASRSMYRYLYSMEPKIGDTSWSRASEHPVFYALPPDLALSFHLKGMDYAHPSPADSDMRPQVLRTQTFENRSPSTITETFKVTEEKTEVFTLGFAESLMIGAKAEFEAGLPLVGSATVEAKTELTIESNQEWTQSTKKSYEITDTIKVDGWTSVTATAIINWADDFSTPFTMKIAVRGGSSRGKLNGQEIEELLKLSGFSGSVDEVRNQEVRVSIRGKLEGAFGVRTLVKAEGERIEGRG